MTTCNFCGSKQSDVRMVFGDARLKTFICASCVESAVFQLRNNGIEPFCHMIQPNVVQFSRADRPSSNQNEGQDSNG
jgi:hypothetical protein